MNAKDIVAHLFCLSCKSPKDIIVATTTTTLSISSALHPANLLCLVNHSRRTVIGINWGNKRRNAFYLSIC